MSRPLIFLFCMACLVMSGSAYKVVNKSKDRGVSFYVFPLSGQSGKHGLQRFNDEAACAWDNASCFSPDLIDAITDKTKGERIGRCDTIPFLVSQQFEDVDKQSDVIDRNTAKTILGSFFTFAGANTLPTALPLGIASALTILIPDAEAPAMKDPVIVNGKAGGVIEYYGPNDIRAYPVPGC